MKNYKELLDRAKLGQISSAEVASVAEDLDNDLGEADPYTLLHILGKASAKSYAPLVERFLDYESDPMVARIALQVLCDWWNLSAQHIREVKKFIQGVPWDGEEDVRRMALSIAGEYLRQNRDPELLRQLFEVFEDDNQSQSARESAYFGLARAVGRDWKELPSAARHFDLTSDIDSSVINSAKERMSGAGQIT